MKSKVMDFVTERIIAKIEAGGADFLLPFSKGTGAYRNAVSGKAYRGINVLMAGLCGDGDTVFATYPQWQKILFGDKAPPEPGMVLKDGVTGTGVPIVYFKMMDKTDPVSGDKIGTWPMLRYSTVFGVSKVNPDLLPDRFKEPAEGSATLTKVTNVEEYVANTGAEINRNGNSACYYPALDKIEMPKLSLWSDISKYYPVLLHELTHWTKHESRCNRKQSKKWGDRDYAFEELIAELGAAFQCRTLKLHNEVRDDHAAYVGSWLKSMKGDSSYIFDAAKLAQEAVDYIESLQPQEKAA